MAILSLFNWILEKEAITLAELSSLQQDIGISFSDQSVLKQAMAHSSYINENPDLSLSSNERLEFLGDAILDFVIAEKLFYDFPQLTEGEMTKFRAALVRRDSLARMARDIKLGDYLYLGKGEEASGGRNKPANLAGAFEAILAAILLDQNLKVTRDFILRLFNKEFKRLAKQGTETNHKSQLQEIMQAKQHLIPTYHVLETTGPAHNKKFTVEVRIGDIVLGKGTGKSKKRAEVEAAKAALREPPISFTL